MKKLISTLFITIFSLTIGINSAFAFYSDVYTNNYWYDSIKEMYDLGLLPEYEENAFNPFDTFTLDELYKILLTYGQAEISTDIDLPYTNTDKAIGT